MNKSEINTEVQEPGAGKLYRKVRARGALTAISFLLVLSALIRIGLGADIAQATEAVTSALKGDESKVEASDELFFAERNFNAAMEQLNLREDRLNKQEIAFENRRRALALVDAEVEKRLAELKAAEEELRATIAIASTAAENDLAQLTRVYASMKPKQAAPLFEAMEPDFAAGFLGRMKPDQAAAILAGMPPEVAYTISVVLAGRNANAPKQ